MEAIEAEVLDGGKRDGRGRKMLPEHEWKRLLKEYDKSGLTQKAFARREGINVNTLVAWLGRRRKKMAGDQTNKPVRFQELALSAGSSPALEVHLPGGLVLKGGTPKDLAELVLALRE